VKDTHSFNVETRKCSEKYANISDREIRCDSSDDVIVGLSFICRFLLIGVKRSQGIPSS
jgi:hypothetical protein